MIGLDTTQVATLAEGWGYTTEDVDEAICIADTLEMPIIVFVGQIDEIVAQLRESGCEDAPNNTAATIMYCMARLANGLPLE